MKNICNNTLSNLLGKQKWSTIFNCTKLTTEKHQTCQNNLTERYRTINGTCNNIEHPDWGSALIPFRRSIPPWYEDGISSPRKKSIYGLRPPLPSPLVVSKRVHRPLYRKDPQFTVMLAVWGQFLDHDITATAVGRAENGIPIQCCTGAWQEKFEESTDHPECLPVFEKPAPDEEMVCMEFIRSAPAPSCCLGTREQMNQATAYIDGSMVNIVHFYYITSFITRLRLVFL